jgi:hypothetical protein
MENSGEIIHPNLLLVFLIILTENVDSASENPVTQNGFSLFIDGLSSIERCLDSAELE